MLYAIAALALLAVVIMPIVTHHADKRAGLIKDRIHTNDNHHANAMAWRHHNAHSSARRVYPINEDTEEG